MVNHAVVRHPGICLFRHNSETEQRQRRAIGIAIRALLLGVLLGIGVRIAWDHGIITSVALEVEGIAVAIWNMFGNLAAACWNILQWVLRQRN
jgi:hypothetical protein